MEQIIRIIDSIFEPNSLTNFIDNFPSPNVSQLPVQGENVRCAQATATFQRNSTIDTANAISHEETRRKISRWYGSGEKGGKKKMVEKKEREELRGRIFQESDRV